MDFQALNTKHNLSNKEKESWKIQNWEIPNWEIPNWGANLEIEK